MRERWRRFGSLTEQLWELRLAARSLAKDRLFTIVAILSLALGIGANAAVFALVDAIWLRPLHVRDPRTLVVFYSRPAKGVNALVTDSFPWSALQALQREARALAGVTAEGSPRFEGARPRVSLPGGEPLAVTAVSDNYFQVLGVNVRGRPFTPRDDAAGASPVAILSHDLWVSRFRSDPGIVGRTVLLSDRETVIAGVAAPGFRGPRLGDSTDLWLPLHAAGWFLPDVPPPAFLRTPHVFMPLRLYGRVRADASLPQAQAEAAALASVRGSTTFLRTLAETAYPLRAQEMAGHDRDLAWLLAATAMVVFLAGCVSLAGLLLARMERRHQEIAIRVALGISRWRLVRLLAGEAVLVAALGGAAALVVSMWFLRTMATFSLPTGVAISTLQLAPNWRLVAFTAGTSLVAMILCGVIPALGALKMNTAFLLAATRSSGSRSVARGRSVLLASHVALALVLFVGAALFTESVRRALATDLRFERDRTIFVLVTPNLARYADALFKDVDTLRLSGDYERLQERLRALPGVRIVTEGRSPLSDPAPETASRALQGISADGQVQRLPLFTMLGGPSFFTALGSPLVAGRDFEERDVSPNAPAVAIVNEALARQLWRAGRAVGRRFSLVEDEGTHGTSPKASVTAKGREAAPSSPTRPQDIEVIGVVSLSARQGVRGPEMFTMYRPATRTIDNPAATGAGGPRALTIATAASARSLVPIVTAAARDIFPDAYTLSVSTAKQEIARQMTRERMGATLFSWFSAIALALCLIGVWGLVAYTIARRQHDIAVRLALGAQARTLVILAMWRGLAPALTGCIIGVAGSVATTRLVTTYLFGISPLDSLVFAVCVGLVAAVSAAAALAPALRVLKLDPLQTLREP